MIGAKAGRTGAELSEVEIDRQQVGTTVPAIYPEVSGSAPRHWKAEAAALVTQILAEK